MDMRAFSRENRARCEAADGFNHPLAGWSLSDWMTATLGEIGEAANIAKKLNRVRDGIPGNTQPEAELRSAFADELADAFIYLDLMAQREGIDLASAVRAKFDATSARIGYAARAGLDPQAALEAAAYLRAEADFNRSWTDGRRGAHLTTSREYRARRIELAEQRERWAAAIEAIAAAEG